MHTNKVFQEELKKVNKLLIVAEKKKNKKTHKDYFALAKIFSSTALLVLSMAFYCCQEVSTYTQILCIKFVRLNLSVLPKYLQYLLQNR